MSSENPHDPRPTVSSSESGAGSSALTSGATPRGESTPTVPTSPDQRAGDLKGEQKIEKPTLVHSSMQTELFCVGSFSSKTCLELLPQLSTTQLNNELTYRQSLGFLPNVRMNRHTDKSVVEKHLFEEFLCAIPSDLDNIVKKCQTLTDNFSYIVEQAQAEIDKLKTPSNTTTADQSKAAPVYSSPPVDTGKHNITDSVCNVKHSVLFGEFTTDNILDQFPIEGQSTCGRFTNYFGNRPYTYGRARHEPQQYPDCELFTTIEEGMKKVDPDFSLTDYTCLVTHYPNGRAYIPRHSDDEKQIEPDSTIHTISIGASRTLRLTNTLTFAQHDFQLNHGSLSSMSCDSQSDWRHEILRDNSISEPRISFTFRRLTDLTPKPTIPPIKQPEPVKPSMSKGDFNRILFLTDSVLLSTPESAFNKIQNHKCIKKANYRLTDIFNFDEEFGYSKFVVISGGLNDMSRYGLSAHTLADLITNRLTDTCNKYENTMFIFCSVLHTKHQWLNGEIDRFNQIMFELSITIPNMRFLDTHHAIVSDRLSDRTSNILNPNDKNGTHLTLAAKKLVTNELVFAVELIAGRRLGLIKGSKVRGWSWPLRKLYVTIFREIAHKLTNGVMR